MKTLQEHIDDLIEKTPELSAEESAIALSWFKFTFAAGAIAALKSQAEGGKTGDLSDEARGIVLAHIALVGQLTPSKSVH